VLSGEETFSQLKAIKPSVRVILSSGYNEVEAIRRFYRQGAGRIYPEAVRSTALWEKVRTVIQEWKAFDTGAAGT